VIEAGGRRSKIMEFLRYIISETALTFAANSLFAANVSAL